MRDLFQALTCAAQWEETDMVHQMTEQGAAVDSTHGALRILAADDNRGNQMLIRTFLKKFNLTVDVVDNGIEALNALRQTIYDVVFMDVNMPVMDGLEATRHIRAEIAADRQPWIVAITANVAMEDRQCCIEAGMNDFIEKPFVKAAFQRVFATVHEHKKVTNHRIPPEDLTSDERAG